MKNKSKALKIGLVGSGCVATHLHYYLSESGYSITRWNRCQSQTNVKETLSGCSAILLAISDDAIEPFVREHLQDITVPLIHFSGAKTILGVTGFHPLMTFTEKLFPLEFYPTIPFVCESGGAQFNAIFPTLGNPVQLIGPDKKSLYHALCVLSGNFTALLWAKTETAFAEQLGLDPKILAPYRERQFSNINTSPLNALSGPLLRGDTGTIETNLKALEGDPYHQVYQAFVEAYKKETHLKNSPSNNSKDSTTQEKNL